MRKYFLDTETCGLHGMPVLIQYAIDNGPIMLYEPWKESVENTRNLLDEIAENCFIGFNNSFDWFHLAKMRTIWDLLPSNFIPESDINFVASFEKAARDGKCFKPASCFDIFLYTKKGPLQKLMAREPIRIKKVPVSLARLLADELENRVKFDDIMFARRADSEAPKWKVLDRTKNGVVDHEFKDVVLNFHPAGGLKYLAEYVLGEKPDFHFSDIELDKSYLPFELGFAPYAESVSKAPTWEVEQDGKIYHTWPAMIKHHIEHWHTSMPARKYAEMDVVYTRKLYEYYEEPAVDDVDSILACMVAAVRWHGFEINAEEMESLRLEAVQKVASSPVNINKPSEVRTYLTECMDDTEALIIEESTKKANIEQIVNEYVLTEDEICIKCLGDGCPRCDGKGELQPGPMPVAVRAKKILEVKEAIKEVELYSKLILAGRFHASFRVIGTLSSRMSGSDGLNPQGIKHAHYVRKQFPLAWEGMVLSGGDFDSFEITLADAVYGDEKLREDLKSGKKIHALMGQALFPGTTYEDIVDSSGTDNDMYTKGKQAVFAMLYGGDENTIHQKLSIPIEIARKAMDDFQARYPGIKKTREATAYKFQALTQPRGIGTEVKWDDPSDYAETFLGFRRYFTLENECCKAIYDLARSMPRHWHNIDIKVARRDRLQTAAGAVSSALYGATFAIQSANVRAAGNHYIQSPGAQICKALQAGIWTHQPHGFKNWVVAPMNIHDEIMCVTKPEATQAVAETVKEVVESYRPQVPLIGMKWCLEMENWAEKKGGHGNELHIKA